MKTLLLLLLSSVVLFANIGKITSVQGEVYVTRVSGELKATSGFILKKNDEVITKDKAKALLLFNDNTLIKVGKNSKLSVNEFVLDEVNPKNSKASFGFGNGLFRTITGKIGKLNKEKFKIKAKSASIGIRGTVFDVAVAKEEVKVGVIEGGIYYVDEKTMQSFEVKEGEKLVYDDTTGEVAVSVGVLEESKEMEKDPESVEETEEEATEEEATEEETTEEETTEETTEEETTEESTDGESTDGEQPASESTPEQTPEEQPAAEPTSDPVEPAAPTEPTPDPIDPVVPTNNLPNIDEITKATEDAQKTTDDALNDAVTNTAPVINIEKNTLSLNEDSFQNFSFTYSDIDKDDTLRPIVTASNGVVTFNEDGSYTYAPNSNFNGTDTINISVSDGTDTTSTQVTVAVNAMNDDPIFTITSTLLTTTQTEPLTVSYDITDIDGDTTYVESIISSNGQDIVLNNDNTFTYTPSNTFAGTDTLYITYSDGTVRSISISADITVDLLHINSITGMTPSGDYLTPSELDGLSREIVGGDNYMEFGYLITVEAPPPAPTIETDVSVQDGTNKIATYITGDVTDGIVIDNYIGNNVLSSYSGQVASFVNGTPSTGSFNINMNFGTQTFTGNVNIDQGDWQAVINSGSITRDGFDSTAISSATTSSVSDITGSMNGNFYGPSANSVGGNFNLNSATAGSVNGVFGGSQPQ
ncbi:MAG: cadherin-like domain-containing protein [Campylobacterota bacterium]|nr:cadherin-like domain-containing protein [Campylobacterota bacterium]